MKPIVSLENAPEVLSKMGFGIGLVRSPVRAWCTALVVSEGREIPVISDITVGNIPAHINHNRWIVSCPLCSGAMLASKSDPIFWCVNCENQANKGHPMAVVFPKRTGLIEWILMKRPDPATRNWKSPESIDDLIRENKRHGVH